MSKIATFARQRGVYKRFIQYELDSKGMNQADVARSLGVSSVLVSATINGLKNSGKVLDKLREIGVPEEYLFDPRRLEGSNSKAA